MSIFHCKTGIWDFYGFLKKHDAIKDPRQSSNITITCQPASSISAQLLFRNIPLARCMSVRNSVFFVERHKAQLLATTLSPASTRNEVWKWFPMHFPFESLIHKFHRLSKRWLNSKSVKTLVGWVAKTSPMKPAITRLPVISCEWSSWHIAEQEAW